MAAPVAGAGAAAVRLRVVLETHLQTAVDLVRTERGFTPDVTVNDVVLAASSEPATRPGSVLVSVLRESDSDVQVYNYAGPVKVDVTLRARAQVGTADLTDLEVRRDIMAAAITYVATGYMRRDGNPACVRKLRCRVDESASSPRQREQVVGMRARPLGQNAAGQDNIDPVDVFIDLKMHVTRPAPI
jgi:hypothetical protein